MVGLQSGIGEDPMDVDSDGEEKRDTTTGRGDSTLLPQLEEVMTLLAYPPGYVHHTSVLKIISSYARAR